MADIIQVIPRAREPNYCGDPTDVSVAKFFDGTPSKPYVGPGTPHGKLLSGGQFGNRTPYQPSSNAGLYNKRQAQRDAEFLSNVEELNSALRDVVQVKSELSVQVAVVRGLSPSQRRGSFFPRSLYILCAELHQGLSTMHEGATRYARLAVEIDERINDAQRYIVELS